MAPVVIEGVPIGKYTGPWMLGFMFSYFFFGILVVQLYFYIINFPRDSLFIKTMVAAIYFLETIFAVFCTITAYHTFGTGWGDLDVLTYIHWSWLTESYINSLTQAIAQAFYIWRIWKLMRNVWQVALIETISILSCASLFYFGVKFTQIPLFSLVYKQNTSVIIWLVSAAVCDILITSSLVFYLVRAKKSASNQSTDRMINNLLRYSIETGMLTAIAGTIELILWVTMPEYNYHFISYLTIARLYANALMATLNSRASVFSEARKRRRNETSYEDATGTISGPTGGPTGVSAWYPTSIPETMSRNPSTLGMGSAGMTISRVGRSEIGSAIRNSVQSIIVPTTKMVEIDLSTMEEISSLPTGYDSASRGGKMSDDDAKSGTIEMEMKDFNETMSKTNGL